MPTVLPESTDLVSLARRQRDELAVTRWLADRGTPVVPPSPLVPAEPVQRDGFSMTFWEFLEEDRDAEPDYARNAELTAELHAALREYPGELAFLSAAEPHYVEIGLDRLEGRTDLIAPSLLDRARREWEVLGPLVRSRAAFEEAFPGVELRPVHGDCPPANIFQGVDGHRFADFELITLGPPNGIWPRSARSWARRTTGARSATACARWTRGSSASSTRSACSGWSPPSHSYPNSPCWPTT